MSQVITTRNNKQSGGTYVSIKTPDDSSGKFEKSEDNAINFENLMSECGAIQCINSSSANSTIFVGVLNEGDINIKLQNEKGKPDTKQFCIKVSFVKTDTSKHVEYVEFIYTDEFVEERDKEEFKKSNPQGYSIIKGIKTASELEEEGGTQKQMFDSLQPKVLEVITPDTIAMGIVKVAKFEEFTTKVFDKYFRSEQWKDDETLKTYRPTEILTVKIIKWIIEKAKEFNLDLHLFFMDYFGEHISFVQYLESIKDEKQFGNVIKSVTEFHHNGYYKDVYTIVEIVGAYIISILEITGVWNYDLMPTNIMVNITSHSDVRFIDFGYNKKLKDPKVKQGIIGIFTTFYKNIEGMDIHNNNIKKFMLIVSESDNVVEAFSKHYDEIIMNLSSNIQKLVKPESRDKETKNEEKRTKRKIVFKILMFLAFIDGLIQNTDYDLHDIKCKSIMELMFNCTIFNDIFKLVEYSSLDYFKFLDYFKILDIEHGINNKLPIISTLINDRYNMLCNIILDNICSRIAELFKQRYTSSEGGKGISKKRYPRLRKSTRRPLRRKSGTKRLRRRRSRTSRTSRK